MIELAWCLTCNLHNKFEMSCFSYVTKYCIHRIVVQVLPGYVFLICCSAAKLLLRNEINKGLEHPWFNKVFIMKLEKHLHNFIKVKKENISMMWLPICHKSCWRNVTILQNSSNDPFLSLQYIKNDIKLHKYFFDTRVIYIVSIFWNRIQTKIILSWCNHGPFQSSPYSCA